jgi:hypothetical protein
MGKTLTVSETFANPFAITFSDRGNMRALDVSQGQLGKPPWS